MAVVGTSREPIGNYLLDSLPGNELDRLVSSMERVELSSGEVLQTYDESIKYVYFPYESVVALVSATESGATAEASLAGNEGMVGLPVFLGSKIANSQAVTLIAGGAIRVGAPAFRDEFCKSRLMRNLLHLYTNTRLTETSRVAICAQLHSVLERFARWLLLLEDHAGKDEFKLTHELIGEMFGIRREGVTGAAIKLQRRGLIHHQRGRIRIVDRQGLESVACECYGIIKSGFDQLRTANVTEGMANKAAVQLDETQRREDQQNYEAAVEALQKINSRLLIAGIREQKARAEAEEANRAKDEFFATLSHELRTPLNAMLGWSRILRAEQSDKKTVTQAVDVIERNVRAQERLIGDMLDISRIVAGKLRLNLRPLAIVSVIRTAIDAASPAAKAKEIGLQFAPGTEDCPVNGDESRLQQVFGNLLSNAIKFTPRGGRVDVFSRLTESGEVEVTVSDTGSGIEADFLPHIFEKFRQPDSVLTREHDGMGLGLAIAQHVVGLHQGNIKAESRGSGLGAVFTVTLPLEAN